MIHYVYEIKNIINEKIYVGKHSTEDIDDGYMGSGKYISNAIKKDGIENFRKRIIRQFETAEEALEFEKQIVNEQFVKDEKTYNLSLGGQGGKFPWNKKDWRKMKSLHSSEKAKRQWKEGSFKNLPPNWKGKHHSSETKEKLRILALNRRHSDKTRQKMSGKIWISNSTLRLTRRIKKEDLEMYIQQGWIKGRKILWD